MPRDPGTGVYTLPLPPTEPRRIPVTGWANTTVEDLAAAMNSIPGSALAPGAVGTTQLADNSVTNAKMADNAINTAELVDGAVTNAKMADNSVNTAELVDGAVTNAKLAANAVNTAELVDGAVTGPKLAPYNLLVGTLPGETPNVEPNIEIGRTDGTPALPHIDFHAGAVTTDYDARIICRTGTGVAGEGDMAIFATPLTLAMGQLQFPAAQNPSTDPNTLDDYEEGTFTPSITFSTPGNQSISYSNRSGVYTKIGDVVHFQVRITTSTFTHTTASGSLDITGLPFASSANSAASVGFCTGLMRPVSGFSDIHALTISSLVKLYAVGSTTDGSTISGGFAGHTSGVGIEIYVSGSYKA